MGCFRDGCRIEAEIKFDLAREERHRLLGKIWREARDARMFGCSPCGYWADANFSFRDKIILRF